MKQAGVRKQPLFTKTILFLAAFLVHPELYTHVIIVVGSCTYKVQIDVLYPQRIQSTDIMFIM